MKIRNGFVSNSSSSSYVIVLPKKFKLETDDKATQSAFSVLLREKALDSQTNGGWDELYILLKKYIVAETYSGPDDSSYLLLVPNKRIEEIWHENT